jgi:hypothetical protein
VGPMMDPGAGGPAYGSNLRVRGSYPTQAKGRLGWAPSAGVSHPFVLPEPREVMLHYLRQGVGRPAYDWLDETVWAYV